VPVGASVGGVAEEEPEAGFTDKDYSDYNPEEEHRPKEPVPAEGPGDLVDEHNIDEDRLYEE
jgi:hypothetical protein